MLVAAGLRVPLGRVRIAAECKRLESARQETVRGFKSHTLRHVISREVPSRKLPFALPDEPAESF